MEDLIRRVDKLIDDFSKETQLPNTQFEGTLPAQYINALNTKSSTSEEELQERKKFALYRGVLFFESRTLSIHIKSY